jgi:hypothetical protein
VKKIHIAFVALLLGLAGVFGTYAATRTSNVAAATAQPQANDIARRSHQLDALEASLKRQLAAKPQRRAASAPAPRVVFRRPAPLVVVRHTHRGENEGVEVEHESEHHGGHDD